MSPNAESVAFVRALLELGFSQYEARCYVGLLGPEPQTGYGVAKVTGVPQPKVYEALRKLAARGAAQEFAGEPVRFLAVPPHELFADLKASFDEKLAFARESSDKAAGAPTSSNLERVDRLDELVQVVASAAASIGAAERRVYLSASAAELQSLRAPVEEAVGRGVDVVILSFGRAPFAMDGLRVFHHASTDGAVYRHHQARHVALVSDSRQTVYAVASDGKAWHGVVTASIPIIAAVKSFIRHDIDMQQIYADFGPQLVKAYGPGLQALEGYRQEPAVAGRPVAKEITAPRKKTG